ncbi:unnamed protein product, partial [marine sediment metagenome]
LAYSRTHRESVDWWISTSWAKAWALVAPWVVNFMTSNVIPEIISLNLGKSDLESIMLNHVLNSIKYCFSISFQTLK